jgi:hypothetical protein
VKEKAKKTWLVAEPHRMPCALFLIDGAAAAADLGEV